MTTIDPDPRARVAWCLRRRPSDVRCVIYASTVPVEVHIVQDRDQPLMFRRGLSTGNRLQPAAAFEFSRTERLQLQVPLSASARPGAGRVLDRNAQPLQLPVQVSERQDPDGQRWLLADATLSALGAGDYVVEVVVSDGAEHVC